MFDPESPDTVNAKLKDATCNEFVPGTTQLASGADQLAAVASGLASLSTGSKPLIEWLRYTAPGFVWRLQTDEGNATSVRPFPDEDVIVAYLFGSAARGEVRADRLQILVEPVVGVFLDREEESANGDRHGLMHG